MEIWSPQENWFRAGSRRSIGLIAAIVALAIYLPLFGLSLAAVLLLEWLVLRRIPALRNWLGLVPSV